MPILTGKANPRGILHRVMDRAASGSHLAFSQVVCSDPGRAAELDARMNGAGIPWQNRTREEVGALLLDGLEPVDPGLVNLLHWRPDPDQPPLPPVPDELASSLAHPGWDETSANTAASCESRDRRAWLATRLSIR